MSGALAGCRTPLLPPPPPRAPLLHLFKRWVPSSTGTPCLTAGHAPGCPRRLERLGLHAARSRYVTAHAAGVGQSRGRGGCKINRAARRRHRSRCVPLPPWPCTAASHPGVPLRDTPARGTARTLASHPEPSAPTRDLPPRRRRRQRIHAPGQRRPPCPAATPLSTPRPPATPPRHHLPVNPRVHRGASGVLTGCSIWFPQRPVRQAVTPPATLAPAWPTICLIFRSRGRPGGGRGGQHPGDAGLGWAGPGWAGGWGGVLRFK